MYQIAVCEDETLVRESLCGMCGEILSERNISYEITPFSSAEALEGAMAAGARFDLLCLDILMGGKSGMDFARQLRQRDEKTSVLFITNSQEFLKDGYEVRPIQYLFKPVDREQLARALETDLRLHHQPDTVTVRTGAGITVLPLDELWYAESRDHLTVVKLEQGERSFRIRLSDMEELLPKDRFCRCHNSYLVNMRRISKLARKGLVLENGEWIPIGRSYYKAAQEKLVRFLNQA